MDVALLFTASGADGPQAPALCHARQGSARHPLLYCNAGVKENGRPKFCRLPDIKDPTFLDAYRAAVATREDLRGAQWWRDKPWFVYFIGAATGPIKIGLSRSPEERLKNLQTSSPLPLRIYAMVRGGHTMERQYHAKFRAARLAGEWFERNADILAEIDFINGQAREWWAA